jgi:glycosyltransferase involved in cell wall biosynthesis
VRGVTYGTFRSKPESNDFPDPETVGHDFASMAAVGINAVRTYTVPPRWLLDLAAQHGLYVMVGVPWEEHVAFLEDRGRAGSIRERVRAGVRACAGHPAVLCYAIGNEIPASIVRWHGRHRIERFLEQLYRAAKHEDAEALVTYVNYPSTEYLQLPFVDLLCFNVFLESGPQFDAYLARLQNIAGDKPLLVTETGLDSRRHTEEAQARALDWQLRSAFAAGCAGAFVFSWTDDWHRGGLEVDDWDFGLVTRDRRPKQALAAVSNAFSELPFTASVDWPRISVIVCAYNGASTLRYCLDGLRALDYPKYEVIVVNDGSTDATDRIALEYGFRLISTKNQGLASARNVGLEASTGEIVAYLDADAWPDPHWLSHIAFSFLTSSHAGVGGPNIPPPGDGAVAECVANAPGGPTHVLLSDREAEHIPGCNMAFRKSALEAIGAFDGRFRVAGDDVDICWQLQNEGLTVGFNAGAVVWHRRRNRVRSYLKQQYEYGKAEALLERKWPDRYNPVGHLAWAGRVYGNGATKALGWRRWKIYYGRWGNGLFQSVYQRSAGAFSSLPLIPEWYLVILALAAVSAVGVFWKPLLLALPLLALASGGLLFESVLGGARASFRRPSMSWGERLRLRSLTALLHMLQPLARLAGRLRHGLSPWRRRAVPVLTWPVPRTRSLWSEKWQAPDHRLRTIEAELRRNGCAILQGGAYDRWDLQVRGGSLGVARLRMAVEEHGGGRHLIRFRTWPKCSRLGVAVAVSFAGLGAGAALAGAFVAFGLLEAIAVVFVVCVLRDCAAATGLLVHAQENQSSESEVELAPLERHKPRTGIAQWRGAGSTAAGRGSSEEEEELTFDDGRGASTHPAPLGEVPAAPQVVPFSSKRE